VNVSHSAEKLTKDYFDYRNSSPQKNLTSYLEDVIMTNLGVKDITSKEIKPMVDDPNQAAYTFADIVSRRAQTGWSTHGHSGMSKVQYY
jgi:alkaline phosphatase